MIENDEEWGWRAWIEWKNTHFQSTNLCRVVLNCFFNLHMP